MGPSFRWEGPGGGERMSEQTYVVYLLASGRNGTLYVGSTVDLVGRMGEHRDKVFPGFTRKYDVTRLMWFEPQESMLAARYRERQIKAWKRQWKIDLFKDSIRIGTISPSTG